MVSYWICIQDDNILSLVIWCVMISCTLRNPYLCLQLRLPLGRLLRFCLSFRLSWNLFILTHLPPAWSYVHQTMIPITSNINQLQIFIAVNKKINQKQILCLQTVIIMKNIKAIHYNDESNNINSHCTVDSKITKLLKIIILNSFHHE